MTSSKYDAYQAWSKTPLDSVPEISVVIPAYNEALRILPTVGAIAAHMSSLNVPWELIVADDGSKDNTVSILQDLNLVNLRVLVAEANGGKGNAVRRGVEASRGSVILFADADQSTPIEQFEMLMGKIQRDGFDIAVGSRADLSSAEMKKSFFRSAATKGLRVLVRFGFGIRIRDTQCGFKLFRADVARELFSQQRIRGFSFDLELLYLAAKKGYKTVEVPVEWIDAPGSTLDVGKVSAAFLVDLCKIRINHFRGLYAATSEGQPS